MKPTQTHIMIDLETLSTRAHATILSIGAVKFNIQDGIFDEFYINVDAKTCKDAGLHIDKNTIAWWQKQKPEALQALMVDPIPVTEALQKFCDWIGNTRVQPWGNGASFDITILEEAMVRTDVKIPWKHWDVMCFRTVMNLMGISNAQIRAQEDDVSHHALDDAKSQARTLLKVLQN